MAALMTGREIHWKSDSGDTHVRIEETADRGTLHLGESAISFIVHDRNAHGGWIELDGRNHQFFVHRNRDEYSVWVDGHTYRLSRVQKGQALDQAVAGGGSGEVRSLMPGKVLRVDVAVGDSVAEKQSLVIMESMKMESALVAPRAGTVKEIRARIGQAVEMGELLVIIE
jgi:biotin carboxyl carrier protein